MSDKYTAAKLVKVVGVTFVDTYPDNLLKLAAAEVEVRVKGERLPALLIRNPNNPHDANAVEVHVPSLGDMAMIGHVARDNAAKLAPRMDAGDVFLAQVQNVRIWPEHIDRPGIDIAIVRVKQPVHSSQ